MSRLDEALREALRREPAPEGFAERVVAAAQAAGCESAAAERPAGTLWERIAGAFRGPQLRWAAGFAAAALVFGVVEARKERERAQGERARDQVMLALRITGDRLRMAQAKVYRVNAQAER